MWGVRRNRMPHPIWVRRGVHYFVIAVEQVQELPQLHEAQSHLSQSQACRTTRQVCASRLDPHAP